MRSEATNLRVLIPCEVEICFANFNFKILKADLLKKHGGVCLQDLKITSQGQASRKLKLRPMEWACFRQRLA